MNRLKVLSWTLYDFANTIYSALVVTVYFPLYVTELTGRNVPVGMSVTASMILAGLFLPLVGALSDRLRASKRFLFWTTLFCVLATAAISLTTWLHIIMLAFVIANVLYHVSLTFYNSLLPEVVEPREQGFVSGLGVGLGYFGVVCALPIAYFVAKNWGMRFVFLVAAGGFLLFSIPLFLWVGERKQDGVEKLDSEVLKEEAQSTWKTIVKLPKNPALLSFLIGNFLCVDALNTGILWLGVFSREVFGFSQGQIVTFIIMLNVVAFIAGCLMGKFTDRFGAWQVLLAAVGATFITFFVCATVHFAPVFIATVLIFGALGITGIWTAGRKLLIELSPPEEIGKLFGLYGLSGKLSAIGSIFFAILADLWGYQSAIWLEVILLAIGAFFILRVGLLRDPNQP